LKNIVVITTILNPQRTLRLAKQYLADPGVDEVFIYDNGHAEENIEILKSIEEIDSRAYYIDTRGLSLHGQWNKALRYAAENTPSNIVLSNDDIEISDFLVTKLSDHIRSNNNIWITYPANKNQFTGASDISITKGTKADGGMDGCCFMVKADAFHEGLPFIDERFIYWGGDDDLVKNVESLQKLQARVNEVYVVHEESSTSTSPGFEWMQEAVANDRILMKEKWGIIR
jgi:GT2 family glycosyltransferase